VLEVGDAAVFGAERDGSGGCGRGNKEQKKNYSEEARPRQWCAMTRSTMLYSFASSALMK
jgi:hypothetical protein